MLDLPQGLSRFPHEKLAMETRNWIGFFEKNK
jgi:hypothetical protein